MHTHATLNRYDDMYTDCRYLRTHMPNYSNEIRSTRNLLLMHVETTSHSNPLTPNMRQWEVTHLTMISGVQNN